MESVRRKRVAGEETEGWLKERDLEMQSQERFESHFNLQRILYNLQKKKIKKIKNKQVMIFLNPSIFQ